METLRAISMLSPPFYDHRKDPFKVSLCYPSNVSCSIRGPAISCSFEKSSHANCGSLSNETAIDISLVNSKIKKCTDDGLFKDAIFVYLNLLECGFPVAEFEFFPCLIKAYGGLWDIIKGMEIHGHMLKLGFSKDVYVNNSLMSMYWKCGAGEHAVKIFEKMERRDSVSWNTMISGYCQSGNYVNSLAFFSMMIKEGSGVYPNRAACLSALSSCASINSLSNGKAIHGFLVRTGLDSDGYLVGGLIEMYMKSGDIKNAQHVFSRILAEESVRGNTVIWNVMISGYVSNECLILALELFAEMLESGINPDSSTLVAVSVLCSLLSDVAVGEQIHGIILRFGLQNDIRVRTALMDMYFKCGDSETGLKIFRQSPGYNLVMWGSVISNCAKHDKSNEALQLFHDFMLDYGFPDPVILLAALRACSSLIHMPRGREIHGLAVKLGYDSDIFVGSALVDLYGKYGNLKSAEEIYYRLPARDLVSWNALISGYAQNSSQKALKAFRDMQSDQIKPNTVTMACIVSACSHLSVVNLCKEVHCYLLRHGFKLNVLVNNSLVSAYAKCGDLTSSWTLFEKMPTRNEISWNSIILGLAMHGYVDETFSAFEQMKGTGMKPDHATFTALLSACSHTGKVVMGWKCFNSMVEDYNLEPRLEQYTCMVDLLGRAGYLDEAYNLIMTMSCFPDDRIWGSLLGSCRNHGNADLAEVVANHIFELDPCNIGYHVLLANLYEDSGKLTEVTKARSEIKRLGLKKKPGCSWIQVNNNIHVFIASDSSHDQSQKIYATIESLTMEMKRYGYTPQLVSATCGADEDEDGHYVG